MLKLGSLAQSLGLSNFSISFNGSDSFIKVDLSSKFDKNEQFIIFLDEGSNNIVFCHFLNDSLDIETSLFNKTIPFDPTEDETFIISDITDFVNNYYQKILLELNQSNNDVSKRLTVLKHNIRLKSLEMEKIKIELDTLKNEISPFIIEEANDNGYKQDSIIIIKDEFANHTFKDGKKYYINKLVVKFNTKDFIPVASPIIGRVHPDGDLNYNIISSDNDVKLPITNFNVVNHEFKEKFAEQVSTTDKTKVTYNLNNNLFPEINNSIIRHKNGINTLNFFHSFERNYKHHYLPSIDKTYHGSLSDKVKSIIEFAVDETVYIYISFDKNFIMNKKNVQFLIDNSKENNGVLLKLQSKDYIYGSFDSKCTDLDISNNLCEYLYNKMIKSKLLFKPQPLEY